MKNRFTPNKSFAAPSCQKKNGKSFAACKSAIILFLFIFSAGLSASAQKTWVLNGNGNWSVAANWSGGTVPTATDDVVINVSGSRTVTLDVNATVKSFTLSGNGDGLTISGTNTLTITGTLSQSNGTITCGSGTIRVGGNWSKTAGTFTQGSSTLEFNGSSAQTISVNDNPRNLNNLTINNTSGGVSLVAGVGNLTVNGVLAMNSGKLSISTNTLTLNGSVSSMTAANCFVGSVLTNITVGGTGSLGTLFFDQTTPGTTNNVANFNVSRTSSGNVGIGNDVTIGTALTMTNGIIQTIGSTTEVSIKSTGSVSRTNGYVSGTLQKYVPAGAITRTFEIGDNNYYTPVSITFGNVTAAGDLAVSTSTPLSSHPNIGTVGLNTSSAVNRYWTLTNVNTIAFTNYSATFNFNAADLIGAPATGSLLAGLYNSGWTYPTMGTRNATNTTITGVSSFGSVILATCATPTAYAVTGGGAYCSGGSGSIVGLSNSQAGVTYQLQLNGTNTGSPVAGTGSAISFGNQTAVGTYTVVATNTLGSCTSNMTGSVTVSINPLPSMQISGNTSVCAGTSTITLAYSNLVNSPDQYSITWDAAALAAGFTNQSYASLSGGTLTINNIQPVAGTYLPTLKIRNSTTGCESSIAGGSLCSTVNENQTLSMTAPNGLLFSSVTFASYGTPNGTCGSFTTSSCHAATSVSVVQAAAIGQNSFSLGATNGNFGDPCSGTFKRLYVELAYQFSVTVSSNSQATISGPSSVCNGSSITLTASAGTSYSWSNGATTQSITVSPATNTTYSREYFAICEADSYK